MKIEVLVATMNQVDLSKYSEMNIQSDVLFANQADKFNFISEKINGNTVKMITTQNKGVGQNRNMSLLYATGEICMFSDEDIVYVDGYQQLVKNAFSLLPDADIIIFNIESLNDKRQLKSIKKISRVRMLNCFRYGAPAIVFKRESVFKKNIFFTHLFGGGARYSAGEDSLFLRDALQKGLKIYAFPCKIAYARQENSSWFNGYNGNYFFSKGAWIAAAFPFAKYLLLIYFIFKFTNESEIGCLEMCKTMLAGMAAFNNGVSYGEWQKKNNNCK